MKWSPEILLQKCRPQIVGVAAVLFCAGALVGCGRSVAAQQGPARPEMGPAAQRMVAAGIQGLVSAGDYVCILRDPDQPARLAVSHGTMRVRGAAYQLRTVDGRVHVGSLHSTPAGRLIWNGRLGVIDSVPRQVSAAQTYARDDQLTLVFDFSPATLGPPPQTQMVCRMTVGSDI